MQYVVTLDPRYPTTRTHTILCRIQVGKSCVYAIDDRPGCQRRYILGVSAFPTATGARVAQIGRVHERLRATYLRNIRQFNWSFCFFKFQKFLRLHGDKK